MEGMSDRPTSWQGPPRRPASSWLAQLGWAAANLYAAVVAAYLIGRALTGDRLWPVALLSHVAHGLLLPALVVLPLGWWRRRYATTAVCAAGAVAFLWWYGALFLPQAAPPPAARTLTVLSVNVQAASTSPETLIGLIRAADADLVGIQELSPAQAVALDHELADQYPHQVLHGIGIPGEGLLSRYPIVNSDTFYLQGRALTHIRATLDVDGAPLTVITAHPPPMGGHNGGFGAHPAAGDEIAALVAMAATGGPAILLGDFNTGDQTALYRLLVNAGLVDAFRAAGWGFGLTWPAAPLGGLHLPPLVRIDYIFHTPHFYPQRAWVGPAIGSDHLPVLAELAWVSREEE